MIIKIEQIKDVKTVHIEGKENWLDLAKQNLLNDRICLTTLKGRLHFSQDYRVYGEITGTYSYHCPICNEPANATFHETVQLDCQKHSPDDHDGSNADVYELDSDGNLALTSFINEQLQLVVPNTTRRNIPFEHIECLQHQPDDCLYQTKNAPPNPFAKLKSAFKDVTG